MGTLPDMTDDKPKAEREHADGHEVFVTKDDSGITALSEEEEAADPRVATGSGESGESRDYSADESGADDSSGNAPDS